jgi:hypothetical protein
MAKRSAHVLLSGIMDYAGMFPPASLDAARAAAVYRTFRGGHDRWMVGSVVISAGRLQELDADIGPLSVIVETPSPASIEQVVGLRQSQISALEFRPLPAGDISAVARAVPPGVRPFFELRPGGDVDRSLDAIAAAGASAKIRTGGVTPDAFPEASVVFRLLRGCAARGVPVKATAGLHHALAGRYPLTYDAGSDSAPMYGFLNIAAAAALIMTGAGEHDVLPLLREGSPDAFQFDDRHVMWNGRAVSLDDLTTTREALFRSFGTCSLEEPIAELKRLGVV